MFIHVHTWTNMFIHCMYMYMNLPTCMYMYMNWYIFMYMYIHVYECKYMHVHGTFTYVQLSILNTVLTAPSLLTIIVALQYTSPRYSESCTAFNPFQHHYFQRNMVFTSTYKYIQCTDAVRTGMYLVHNHTSLPIRVRPDQPRDTGESQLRASSAHAEQHPSIQQSSWLTDHPGAAWHVQTATATGLPHTHCCHAGHPLLHCHSCPLGSQSSCAGCTCEEW